MWMLSLMLLAPPAVQPAAKPAGDACVQCHQEMDGAFLEPVKRSAHDIHFERGLSCHSCHGGDPAVDLRSAGPEDSMNPAKGYLGVPQRRRIAELCARCHGNLEYMRRFNPQARVDQYVEYVTSGHGKRYLAGDLNVATCTDCHGAHGIRSTKDPAGPVYPTNVADTCARCHSDAKRMATYGLAVNQQELYSGSVHGQAMIRNRDLSAPTCNDCHGNHGAAPPGVDSVANACGQCHASQWELFSKSAHKAAFMEAGLPACVTCHEHHNIQPTTDAMIGTGEGAICTGCHEAGSRGSNVASEMHRGVRDLQAKLDSARDILSKAERAGMEVSRPSFDLAEGRDRLVRARVEIHSFDLGQFQKVLAEGLNIAARSESSGVRAMEELAFRRKGLAVSSAILLVMIGLLILKIRQLGKDRHAP
jgi:predicted CXXCH cytochrome family protein